jgi:hypothetical protein
MESSLLNSPSSFGTNQSLFFVFTPHEMPFYIRYPLAKGPGTLLPGFSYFFNNEALLSLHTFNYHGKIEVMNL